MMHLSKLPGIALLLVLFSLNTKAQQTKTDTAATKTQSLYINGGLVYMSNLTYAGRGDQSSVPSLLPSITLISKTGLFISGTGFFDLTGKSSHSEGASVTPGFVFSFDDKKEYGGAISATKYFITTSSPIILSSFNASFDGQLYFNPDKVVKLTIAASYRIDKQNQNDIVNSAELSKEIKLVKTGKNETDGLSITPTATLYAGTQSFYQTYYTQSQVQRAVTNPTLTSPINILFPNQTQQQIVTQTVTTEDQKQVKQYNLLALSGSIPLTYAIKPWQINFTPYLIKPYNEVNYVSNTSQGGLFFLFTVGVSATF